ncbi:hypothetical protein BT96DRAFT_73641 [Gymnopus androsaceus JB14]|uniref:Uncharacterized protein n=1 Tax=Gymnopus androsaceus JB14 TaxID=1447944 RepID=A0A6A4HG50_9AGAR|nr:hypothetical protein BT96DRAFT_73641 [Gymnopus androsaceus JB14]
MGRVNGLFERVCLLPGVFALMGISRQWSPMANSSLRRHLSQGVGGSSANRAIRLYIMSGQYLFGFLHAKKTEPSRFGAPDEDVRAVASWSWGFRSGFIHFRPPLLVSPSVSAFPSLAMPERNC